jgi:hypothetical protein
LRHTPDALATTRLRVAGLLVAFASACSAGTPAAHGGGEPIQLEPPPPATARPAATEAHVVRADSVHADEDAEAQRRVGASVHARCFSPRTIRGLGPHPTLVFALALDERGTVTNVALDETESTVKRIIEESLLCVSETLEKERFSLAPAPRTLKVTLELHAPE